MTEVFQLCLLFLLKNTSNFNNLSLKIYVKNSYNDKNQSANH